MQTQKAKIKNDIDELNTCYNLKIQTGTWNEYIATMRPQQTEYADANKYGLTNTSSLGVVKLFDARIIGGIMDSRNYILLCITLN